MCELWGCTDNYAAQRHMTSDIYGHAWEKIVARQKTVYGAFKSIQNSWHATSLTRAAHADIDKEW